jgi:hypothetical protein
MQRQRQQTSIKIEELLGNGVFNVVRAIPSAKQQNCKPVAITIRAETVCVEAG